MLCALRRAGCLSRGRVRPGQLARRPARPAHRNRFRQRLGGRPAVLDGNAAAVYDVALHKDAEVAALGHPFEGEYPWIYPPTFLFAAAALALLPYLAGLCGLACLTFAAYVATIRGIIGRSHRHFSRMRLSGRTVEPRGRPERISHRRAASAARCSVMERRPLVAGCLFGLLSFKPHLGILVPIGAGRRAATGTVIGGGRRRDACCSPPRRGSPSAARSWEAFFHACQAASQAALTDGRADWAKLQSVFGVVRMLGGSEALAWTLQGDRWQVPPRFSFARSGAARRPST